MRPAHCHAVSRIVFLVTLVLTSTLVARSAVTQVPSPAAPRGAPPPKPVTKAVPFSVGETLTYRVSWSSFLTAGQATLKVAERRRSNTSDLYYVVAEGRPTPLVARLYKLYYKVDTLLDAASLLSRRASTYSEEGRSHRYRVTTFDRASRKARLEIDGVKDTRVVTIDSRAQDPLAALITLRTLPVKTGARFVLPVSDNGVNYSVQVTVGGVEPVTTGAGTFRAWRITPVVPENVDTGARSLAVWISEDARRIPVKLQAQLAVGSFELTLSGIAPR